MPIENLTQQDCDFLRRLAEDETAEIPEAVAARLEALDLVMRGWNRTHVVTAAGRLVLSKLPGPA